MLSYLWAPGVEWLLAAAWGMRVASSLRHMAEVPDLCADRYTAQPAEADAAPALSVIVPALNEADAIGACLRSLLASEGVRLEILAVNDRSTDATGVIMEQVALEAASSMHTLRVLHIEALPAGWLGKPHALSYAAGQSAAPLLLFTDADAFYAPDALARAVRYMEVEQADHLVLLPTPILKGWGERMMLGMIQALGLWGVRLWKVPDPAAHDSLGVGCFNLLRRRAYEGIGRFDAMQMEVVEDLRLGHLVKRHGYRQRVAFGIDLLRLHWAHGAMGIVGVLEKNFFAVCRYRTVVMLGALLGTATITLLPFAGLAGSWRTRVPSLLACGVILVFYAINARRTRIPAIYGLLFPVASCLLLYAMMRSAVLTLVRGGVRWRGTLYPLAELRRHAGRLWWWES